MTKAEVKKEYPEMAFTDEMPKEGLENKDILAGMARKAEVTNPAYKENFDQVSILFSKEAKILTISFLFEGLVSGTSMKDLSEKVSDLLKLPTDHWQPSRGNKDLLSIYCEGFGVTTGFNAENKQILFLFKSPVVS